MKCQNFYTRGYDKIFFYVLCFILIFLLCHTYSPIARAQAFMDYYLNYENMNMDFMNLAHGYGMYSYGQNFAQTGEQLKPHAQGRFGLQHQAPEGYYVVPARLMHNLYNFYTTPSQNNPQQNWPYFPNMPGTVPSPDGRRNPSPIPGRPYPFPGTLLPMAIGGSPFPNEVYRSPIGFSRGSSVFPGKLYATSQGYSFNSGWGMY